MMDKEKLTLLGILVVFVSAVLIYCFVFKKDKEEDEEKDKEELGQSLMGQSFTPPPKHLAKKVAKSHCVPYSQGEALVKPVSMCSNEFVRFVNMLRPMKVQDHADKEGFSGSEYKYELGDDAVFVIGGLPKLDIVNRIMEYAKQCVPEESWKGLVVSFEENAKESGGSSYHIMKVLLTPGPVKDHTTFKNGKSATYWVLSDSYKGFEKMQRRSKCSDTRDDFDWTEELTKRGKSLPAPPKTFPTGYVHEPITPPQLTDTVSTPHESKLHKALKCDCLHTKTYKKPPVDGVFLKRDSLGLLSFGLEFTLNLVGVERDMDIYDNFDEEPIGDEQTKFSRRFNVGMKGKDVVHFTMFDTDNRKLDTVEVDMKGKFSCLVQIKVSRDSATFAVTNKGEGKSFQFGGGGKAISGYHYMKAFNSFATKDNLVTDIKFCNFQ